MQSIPRDVVVGEVIKRVDWTDKIFTIWVRSDVGPYKSRSIHQNLLYPTRLASGQSEPTQWFQVTN